MANARQYRPVQIRSTTADNPENGPYTDASPRNKKGLSASTLRYHPVAGPLKHAEVHVYPEVPLRNDGRHTRRQHQGDSEQHGKGSRKHHGSKGGSSVVLGSNKNKRGTSRNRSTAKYTADAVNISQKSQKRQQNHRAWDRNAHEARLQHYMVPNLDRELPSIPFDVRGNAFYDTTVPERDHQRNRDVRRASAYPLNHSPPAIWSRTRSCSLAEDYQTHCLREGTHTDCWDDSAEKTVRPSIDDNDSVVDFGMDLPNLGTRLTSPPPKPPPKTPAPPLFKQMTREHNNTKGGCLEPIKKSLAPEPTKTNKHWSDTLSDYLRKKFRRHTSPDVTQQGFRPLSGFNTKDKNRSSHVSGYRKRLSKRGSK